MKNTKLKSKNSLVFVILGVAFIGLMIFAVTFYQSNSKNIEKYDAQVKMTEEVKVENDKLKAKTESQGESLKTLEQKVNEMDESYKKETENNRILRGKVNKLGKEKDSYKAQVEDLDKKLKDKQARAKKAKEEQEKINSVKSLEGKVASAGESVKSKDKPVAVSRGNSPKGRTVMVNATHYSSFCKGCSGKTYSGINLRANPDAKVVAADPRYYKMGTRVWIEGYGYAVIGDIGGGIKGVSRVDLHVPTEAIAYQKGRKTVKMVILD